MSEAFIPAPPRFATKPTPGRISYGPQAEFYARQMGYELMPWQRLVARVAGELVENEDGLLVPAYRQVIVTVPRQSGKDLWVDTPIATRDGWKTMGTLEVGDIVYGQDGSETKVVYVSETLTTSDCFKFTFTDGSELIAGREHQWYVYDSDNGWNVRTTEDILNSRYSFRRANGRMEYKYRVRCDGVVDFASRDLILDPYILGYWLGDGASANSLISVSAEDAPELASSLGDDFGGSKVRRTCTMVRIGAERAKGINALRRLGVINNKHIPPEYLMSSIEQRIELLRGLMDSDGTISTNSKSPRVEFSVVNERLARDFHQLVRSLGVKATFKKAPAMLNGKRCGDRYRIAWTPTFNPFRLKRKADKFAMPATSRSKWMSIEKIERVPTVPTKCIQVDNDLGVYLAGSLFTPTHNTTLLLSVAVQRALGNPWGGKQNIIYTAQDGNSARHKLLNDFFPDLGFSEMGNTARQRKLGIHRFHRAAGDEAALWKNGSRMSVFRSSADSGHGSTVDLGFQDELFADKDRRRDAAMSPAMVTKDQAQLFKVSTMGTQFSIVWNEDVALGRDAVERGLTGEIAYFEWSADPDADPDDPATWYSCMPALGPKKLGYTQSEAAVKAERTKMEDTSEFRRAYLNITKGDGAGSVFAGSDFDRLVDSDFVPDLEQEVGIAFDVSEDRQLSFIAIATMHPDGTYLTALQHGAGTDWLAPALYRWYQRFMTPIHFHGSGPAAPIAAEAAGLGILTKAVNERDTATASQGMYNAITDDYSSIRFSNNVLMRTSLLSVHRRRLNGGLWVFERTTTTVPLIAMSLARHSLVASPTYQGFVIRSDNDDI